MAKHQRQADEIGWVGDEVARREGVPQAVRCRVRREQAAGLRGLTLMR